MPSTKRAKNPGLKTGKGVGTVKKAVKTNGAKKLDTGDSTHSETSEPFDSALKSKKKATPSLKQQIRKASKVVKADSLNWQLVDIPNNINDFSGCYGLEEIDGVDVKIVNGKAQFIVKDQSKARKLSDEEAEIIGSEELEDQDMLDDTAPAVEEQVSDIDVHLEDEFCGFEDSEDESMMLLDAEKETTPSNDTANQVAKPAIDAIDPQDELETNIFHQLNMELPNSVSMPHWTDNDSKLDLNEFVLNALDGLGFQKPTPIQKETIPLAKQGKDVIGKATTGSGKTLAYGIPILEKYLENLPTVKKNFENKVVNHPTGIVFTPTRELAHQVVDHLTKLAKFTPLLQHGIVTVTGGLSIQKQERLLLHGPGIIVATPGRFLELIEKDSDLCERLSCTDILVLDEADRLLQDGHFEEFEKILDIMGKTRIQMKVKPWKWQTLVFSATFARELFGKLDKFQKRTPGSTANHTSSLVEDDEILQLLNSKLKFRDPKPSLVDANPKEIVAGQITEALVECGATERDLYLYYFLLMYPGSTLVFSNSIDSVKRLVPLLNNLNIPAFAIHSSMMQKQRLRSLERFREASKKSQTAVLIASDVAARGLDIPQIDHVAHYHLPRSADIYIHRLGRTARAGKEGVLIMFCSPQEALGPLRKLRKLVANTSLSKGKPNLHSDVKLLPVELNLVTQLKPRVKLASQLADAQVSSTSTRKEDTWVKQAAEELGIDALSDVEDFEDDMIKKQRKRKEGKLMTREQQKVVRYELRELLANPIRNNTRRSYLTSSLENLAHQMVTGNTHKEVLGHEKVNALDDLRAKKSASKLLILKTQKNQKNQKKKQVNADTKRVTK